MRRDVCAVIIAVVVAATASGASAEMAAPGQPPCVLRFHGPTLCYSPPQLSQTTAHLSFAPVIPSMAVRQVTHLRLSQIIDAGRGKDWMIYFIYGAIPASGHGMIPLPSPPSPKWVLVSEGGHPSSPWRVTRTVGRLPNGKPRYDPWNFYAHYLDATGNFSRQKIKRMGLMILQQASAIHGIAHADVRAVNSRFPSSRASVVVDGLRLTAALPRRVFPRDALVWVNMNLRNISRRVIYVPSACQGPSNPNVAVRTTRGREVYPPLIPAPEPTGPPVAACKAAPPQPLRPGQTLHWRAYAVLRGTRVTARVGLGGPTSYLRPTSWIPVHLRVRLRSSDAPRLTVNTSPVTCVNVAGGAGKGAYLMSEWWLCPGDDPANGANDRFLAPVAGQRITLPCAHPAQWHGVVGRINHSLARFDYVNKP